MSRFRPPRRVGDGEQPHAAKGFDNRTARDPRRLRGSAPRIAVQMPVERGPGRKATEVLAGRNEAPELSPRTLADEDTGARRLRDESRVRCNARYGEEQGVDRHDTQPSSDSGCRPSIGVHRGMSTGLRLTQSAPRLKESDPRARPGKHCSFTLPI